MEVSVVENNIDRARWDELVVSAGGSFLQSWQWGEFQELFGHKPIRLVVNDGKEWLGVVQVIEQPWHFGKKFWYVPRGPVFFVRDVFIEVEKYLKREGRKNNIAFIRLDPSEEVKEEWLVGWRGTKQAVQPQHTIVLDLMKSEDQLLAEMHQKTRYNIRLAEKKGVTVRLSRDRQDVEVFLKLLSEVASREKIGFHSDDYYRKMLETLPYSQMAVAEAAGEILVVNLLVAFGDTVTYLHGASGNRNRDLMAPYLTQWHSIKWARDRGFKRYDFYGVAPIGFRQEHSWSGITRFKEGFRGERVTYLIAHDLVLSARWYDLVKWLKKLR